MATNPNLTPNSVTEGAKRPASGEPNAAVNEDAAEEGVETREFRSPEEQDSADYEMLSGSKTFDPEKLGIFKMSNTFLHWVLKNPPPKNNPENLWKDTLPPGFSAADLREGTDAKATGESALPVRRSRAAPLLIVSGLVLLAIGIFATWPNAPGAIVEERTKGEPEFEIVDKTDSVSTGVQGVEKEDAAQAKEPREASSDKEENEAVDAKKVDTRVDTQSVGDSISRTDSSKGVASAAPLERQPKFQRPTKEVPDPDESDETPSKTPTDPRTVPLFGNQ